MLPLDTARSYKKNHTLRAVLLLSAVCMAGAAFMANYRNPEPEYKPYAAMDSNVSPVMANTLPSRLPESIRKGLPDGWKLTTVTPTEESLWSGKLLLVDENHPIPDSAPPPNTLSIAALGEGKVAVRSMQPSAHEEVIAALKDMFTMGKSNGITSWLVWEGSRSDGQQLELQMERLRQYAHVMPLVDAAARTAREVPAPKQSEHQLAYAVDIRIADGWNAVPDAAPLDASYAGKLLLDNAWQYGFIHRYGSKTAPPYEDEAYHFRFVGLAHSTLIKVLDVDFEQYLNILQSEGTITYYENGHPRYSVITKRIDEGKSFFIPAGCTWEASMDNTGFAVVAVAYPLPEVGK